MRRGSLYALLGLLVIALFVLLAIGPTSAEDGGAALVDHGVATIDKVDKQSIAYRTGINANDSQLHDATFKTNVPAFTLNARQNLSVSARFSNASQTCVVQVVYYAKNAAGVETELGASGQYTLTGLGSQDLGSKYEAATFTFPGFGAITCRIAVVTKPVAGTLDLWVGSF